MEEQDEADPKVLESSTELESQETLEISDKSDTEPEEIAIEENFLDGIHPEPEVEVNPKMEEQVEVEAKVLENLSELESKEKENLEAIGKNETEPVVSIEEILFLDGVESEPEGEVNPKMEEQVEVEPKVLESSTEPELGEKETLELEAIDSSEKESEEIAIGQTSLGGVELKPEVEVNPKMEEQVADEPKILESAIDPESEETASFEQSDDKVNSIYGLKTPEQEVKEFIPLRQDFEDLGLVAEDTFFLASFNSEVYDPDTVVPILEPKTKESEALIEVPKLTLEPAEEVEVEHTVEVMPQTAAEGENIESEIIYDVQSVTDLDDVDVEPPTVEEQFEVDHELKPEEPLEVLPEVKSETELLVVAPVFEREFNEMEPEPEMKLVLQDENQMDIAVASDNSSTEVEIKEEVPEDPVENDMKEPEIEVEDPYPEPEVVFRIQIDDEFAREIDFDEAEDSSFLREKENMRSTPPKPIERSIQRLISEEIIQVIGNTNDLPKRSKPNFTRGVSFEIDVIDAEIELKDEATKLAEHNDVIVNATESKNLSLLPKRPLFKRMVSLVKAEVTVPENIDAALEKVSDKLGFLNDKIDALAKKLDQLPKPKDSELPTKEIQSILKKEKAEIAAIMANAAATIGECVDILERFKSMKFIFDCSFWNQGRYDKCFGRFGDYKQHN